METMTAVRIVALLSAAALAFAQGTPKAQPSDYPVHANLDNNFTLAAEYMVHSVPTPTGSLIADDYLVIDVAFFGRPRTKLNLNSGNFTLRVNQKSVIQPDSPGTVAASIKYPDWTQKPTVSGGAGTGNGGVVYGPPAVPYFPGDPTGRPAPNPLPQQTDPNAPAKEPPMPIDERIQRSALEEGDLVTPTSGLIFFPHRGRTKSIKSLELIYDGPAGKATLKLL